MDISTFISQNLIRYKYRHKMRQRINMVRVKDKEKFVVLLERLTVISSAKHSQYGFFWRLEELDILCRHCSSNPNAHKEPQHPQ